MIKKKSKIKVLVAMSGGVDSSVVAAVLVRAGYDVTGMFAVNFDEQKSNGESCWHGDYQDALRVTAKLGIPLLRWDFKKEYRRDVLDYMYREYSVGRTPNPDVLCNKFIKFGAWLDRARQHGFDFIATGHYARLRSGNSKFKIPNYKEITNCKLQLLNAKDDNKDQTYFLHQLNQDQLSHTMFPIGEYTKPEVRKLAKKFDLPTAEKEESMGICFVGEVSMRDFLKREIKPVPGDVVLSDDTKVGEHEGLAFHTIGERIAVPHNCHSRGSGNPVANRLDPRFHGDDSAKPFFVVDKNFKKNQLIVGHEDDRLLYKFEISVSELNWVSGQPPKFPLKCKVRLRHRQPLQDCVVCHPEPCLPCLPDRQAAGRRSPFDCAQGKLRESKDLSVKFTTPQRAVTSGQFAVFYKNNYCLGGGVIK